MSTLVIDANYLGWRAYYSTGELSYGDVPTGVLFGFLRDVADLVDRFLPKRIVFAFDVKPYHRAKILPTYKEKRDLDKDHKKVLDAVRRQITLLRDEQLPALGFNNVFHQKGYESDDVIAQVTSTSAKRCTIVSADHDLYQLLTPRVVVYNPNQKSVMTDAKFRETYKVEPSDWPIVKAIAGCVSDNIRGVHRIGESLACKYVNKTLPTHWKQHQEILRSKHVITKNLTLVKLPFPGMRTFKLRRDDTTIDKWQELVGRFGMKSLAARAPTCFTR